MPTLTTGALATEDLTLRLTVVTLNAVAHPRVLLSDLAGALERREKDLGTY